MSSSKPLVEWSEPKEALPAFMQDLILGHRDIDQHDEDHDTHGNQSEANFWRKEE